MGSDKNENDTNMGDELDLVGGSPIETGQLDGLAVVGARGEPAPAEGNENYLIIRMNELLPDSGGDIVLLDDAGEEGFVIVT